jgi:serine/threonine protein phosphatase PrpC
MIQFHFSAKTDVGLVRQANEDNLGNALTPNGHVFVVCDGMGGHVGGAKASQIAVSSIIEFFTKQEYDNLFTAIDRSLVFANEQIYAVSMSQPELKGMGTTAVILIIKEDACYIGHVGDSRIYLKSGGKLNRITKDHSFVQTLVDSKVITDEQAESHPKKNQILKALGIGPIVEPTVADSPILPKNGDVFLMCSDGLNGMVNDASMEMMVDENDLDKSTSVLIQAANDSGGNDNITVTLVGIQKSPHVESVFKHFNPKKNNHFFNTENIEQTAPTAKSFLKNKYFYIAASLGLVIICIGVWLFLSDSNSNKSLPGPEDILTKESLSNRDLEDLLKIKSQRNKIISTNDTIPGSVCKCQIVIKDSLIVDLIKRTKKERTLQKEEHRKKEERTLKSAPECGKEYSYQIKPGDRIEKIYNKYKVVCDSLTKDYLISVNNNSDKVSVGDTLTFDCLCRNKNGQ